MLNIVTVHWQSPKWIDAQLGYLERNVETPYRVFAVLNGIDPEQWKRFHYATDIDGTHAEKLNALAQIVLEQSGPDDQLLFLDGDTFPVQPIGAWMDSMLRHHRLAAVRRDENLGDRQPHPCFCVTTSGLWNEIKGDWREGGTWTNSVGDITTDVGGTLLHQLDERQISWLPLLRSNTSNANPLWFGVYEHRVYHHGAGFRSRISRVGYHAETAAKATGSLTRGRSLEGLAVTAARRPSLIVRLRPRHLAQVPGALSSSVTKQQEARKERLRVKAREREERHEQEVYDRLQVDPSFYREFDHTRL